MQGKVDWRGEYHDKTVCVVGGTSGIGLAIAEALHGCDAKVFVTGSHEASVRQARQATQAQCDVLDVRNSAAITAYCGKFARLDVLVNSVGISVAFRELETEQLKDVLDVNLSGVAQLCAAMHPALKAAGGAVINFASMTSFFGSGSNPIYAAAKGGIVQLTKSLAVLWGGDGIRVNAVAPGYVRTRLTARRWQDQANSERIIERTPIGRWGEVEDIVGPVLFLGSSAAAFMTGAILPVDGGYLVA